MACIKKGINSREKTLPLYKTLVWPHLEYAVQFWAPVLRRDVLELERVHRMAAKLIMGLEDLSNWKRLQALNLFSLEKRRLRGDMISMYKYGTIGIKLFCERELKIRSSLTLNCVEGSLL